MARTGWYLAARGRHHREDGRLMPANTPSTGSLLIGCVGVLGLLAWHDSDARAGTGPTTRPVSVSVRRSRRAGQAFLFVRTLFGCPASPKR